MRGKELALSKATIEALLSALGDALAVLGLQEVARIIIFGGVYMLLAVENRASTHDVDIILADFIENEETLAAQEFKQLFEQAVKKVADERHIPRNWMNTDGALFVAPCIPLAELRYWKTFHKLAVYFPSKENMLALKLTSFRPRDRGDVESLCVQLDVKTRVQAQTILDRYVPPWWQEENLVQDALDELFYAE